MPRAIHQDSHRKSGSSHRKRDGGKGGGDDHSKKHSTKIPKEHRCRCTACHTTDQYKTTTGVCAICNYTVDAWMSGQLVLQSDQLYPYCYALRVDYDPYFVPPGQ